MTGVRLEGQREAIAAGADRSAENLHQEVGVELDWKRKKHKTYEETVILSWAGWQWRKKRGIN